VLPTGVTQYFMPGSEGKQLAPRLYAAVDVSLSNARLNLSQSQRLLMTTPVTDSAIPVDWNQTHHTTITPDQLQTALPVGAALAPLPSAASKAGSYTKWSSQLRTWISDTQSMQLFQSGSEVSRPGESQRDFLARIALLHRESRDGAVDKLRDRYQSRRAALEDKVERTRVAISRESQQAASQRMDVAISVGSVLAGALLGRRLSRRTGKAVRSAGEAAKQGGDVKRAREAYDQAVQELNDFDANFQAEATGAQLQPADVKLVTVKPGRDGVQVSLLALVWAPDGV